MKGETGGMRAVLLAAGIGSRLRPLTDLTPKCLMPVNGRPLLEYWLNAVAAANIDPVLINLHHHADMVADIVNNWLDSGAFPNTVRLAHEKELLGTGGTLLANREFCGDGPVLVVHADNLCGADLSAFVQAHLARPAGTEITMMTFVTDNPSSCGIVELDSRGVVVGFHEKTANPPGNLANGAVYIVEKSVLDFLASKGKRAIDFSTEVLPYYLGRIATFHNDVFHCDIGSPQAFLQAQYLYDVAHLAPSERREDWANWTSSLPMLREFSKALAQSLGALLIEVDGAKELAASVNGLSVQGPVLLCYENCEDPEEAAAAVALKFSDCLDSVVVCFSAVPAGFSSAALYRGCGVKTVALSVSGREQAAQSLRLNAAEATA